MPLLRLASLVFLLGGTAVTGAAQIETKLIPESVGAGDFFGRSVALSADGRFAVVGASEEAIIDTTDVDLRAGTVYVYERAAGYWIERQQLSASDADSLTHFGRAVAISEDGSRIFVGAPYAGLGAVYVFARESTKWVEEAKLQIIDGCGTPHRCRFGWAVAASSNGDVLVVGAPEDVVFPVRHGSLNVYYRTQDGWVPITKLTAESGSYLGIAAAISADGTRAFAGTHLCCTMGQTGRVFVFQVSDGTWTQAADLSSSTGELDNRFGSTLAVTPDGNWLLVGARASANSTGAAYVFAFDGTHWSEEQRLTASDGGTGDQFGGGVALSSDGGVVVVAAPIKDAGEPQSGAAYVFLRSQSGWDEQAMIAPSEPGAYDFFGSAVSLTPNATLAIFGAWAASDHGQLSGAAYIFDVDTVISTEETPLARNRPQLTIYPNPASGNTSIVISISEPSNATVSLLDRLGREVLVIWTGSLHSGDNTLQMDMSSLASGVYFLHASTPSSKSVSRIVVIN